MGIFARLFKKEETHLEIPQPSSETIEKMKTEEEWKAVPAYIDANAEDYELVSLIATAIATGNQPESQFVVKKILQRNPEATLVSIIATSLAAGVNEESQFVVKKIVKK